MGFFSFSLLKDPFVYLSNKFSSFTLSHRFSPPCFHFQSLCTIFPFYRKVQSQQQYAPDELNSFDLIKKTKRNQRLLHDLIIESNCVYYTDAGPRA